MATNIDKIRALYDAFGQGNVPFILESVADNFTWTDPSNPAIVPHGGVYSGRDAFGQFFQNLVSDSDTFLWQVDGYVADSDTVVATGMHGIKAKTTGKEAQTKWVMIWKFENDQPVHGQSYYDTATLEKIFQ